LKLLHFQKFAFSCLALATVLSLAGLGGPPEAWARTRPKGKAKAAPVTEPAAARPEPPAAAPAPPPPPRIALASGLRFSIRPTLLGLVPPEDESGYGECFVRVIAVPAAADPGLRLQFELKERQDHSNIARASQLDGVTNTRIRRGSILVKDLSQAQGLESPLSWGEGGFETSSGLLWISPANYSTLLSQGWIPWQDRALGAGGDATEAEAAPAADSPPPLRLDLIARDAGYPVRVNGALVELPALRLRDSAGRCDYWLLDDPLNPLILKQSLRPVALDPPAPGGTGAVEASTPQATRSASRAAPASPPAMAPASAADGAGFAIVSIDF